MPQDSTPIMVLGLTRVRDHCTFTWREPPQGGPRTAEVKGEHCAECIAALRRRGYLLVEEIHDRTDG